MSGPRRALVQAICLSLVVLASELAGSYLLWRGEMPVISVVGLRFLSCVMMGAAAFAWRGDVLARSICIQMAIWVAIGGPFGAVIAWGLILFGHRKPLEGSFGDWVDQQTNAQTESEFDTWRALILDDRLRIEGANEVEPLCDILDGDDQRAKLRALSVISRRFDPAMILSLRTALKDGDAAVRVMGASVLAKLQKDFGDRVRNAQKEADEAPDSAEAQMRVAQERLAYVRSGLLNEDRVREERGKAIETVMRTRGLTLEGDNAKLEFGALLIEIAAYHEAFTLLCGEFSDEFTQARAANLRGEAHAHLAAMANQQREQARGGR